MPSLPAVRRSLIGVALALAFGYGGYVAAERILHFLFARRQVIEFNGPCPVPSQPSIHIKYAFDLTREHFHVYVPKSYDGKTPWGLMVYISPQEEHLGLGKGWAQVLKDDRLLFICPQKTGNEEPRSRREGLAVVAALEMSKRFNLDVRRIYAAGLSGGGRIASDLGLHQPDIFRASIQCCGSDYDKQVPRVAVTEAEVALYGGNYGRVEADSETVQKAKTSFKFALITGSGDFREHFIEDIYNGGFAAEGFQAKLWDVPGMGHELCSASTLREALAFIEGNASCPATP